MPSDASLLARWAAISFAAFLSLYAIAPPHLRCIHCFSGKVDVAKMTVQDYAYKAYPAWIARHPGHCPATVMQLEPWMDRKDDKDPWGGTYRLICASPHGIVVISAGEDGVFGTRDDIRSDE